MPAAATAAIQREWAMGKIIVVTLAFIFAASANAESRCDSHRGNTVGCLLPLGGEALIIQSKWRVAQDVLCCCKTYSGGECCARVAVCAGKIPGCFCASRVRPGARPVTPPTTTTTTSAAL